MWRTVRGGDTHLRLRDWILVGIGTVLLPALCGWIGVELTHQFFDDPSPRSLGDYIAGSFTSLMIAPFAAVFLILPALLIGALALRRGWAGWASATLTPVVIAAALTLIVSFSSAASGQDGYGVLGLLLAANGAVHGGIMWICLRLLRPEAVARRDI